MRLRHPVWFVRHGQTDWNAERRFQGHSDIALNDTGRAQAARNGAALKAAVRDARAIAFISSPLSRATETLEIVREAMGLPRQRYAIDDRLIEIDLGAWNGRTYDEIAAEDPGVHERRATEKWSFRAPGGESYADAAARVREFLTTLKRPAVIAGHGASGRIARAYLLGLKPSRAPHLPSPQDQVFEIAKGGERTL
ncbi:MAG: histidine phosphatase family protein [Parvularculaceae bacterium]